MTNTRLTDAEIFERRYPVILHKFGLRKGNGTGGFFFTPRYLKYSYRLWRYRSKSRWWWYCQRSGISGASSSFDFVWAEGFQPIWTHRRSEWKTGPKYAHEASPRWRLPWSQLWGQELHDLQRGRPTPDRNTGRWWLGILIDIVVVVLKWGFFFHLILTKSKPRIYIWSYPSSEPWLVPSELGQPSRPSLTGLKLCCLEFSCLHLDMYNCFGHGVKDRLSSRQIAICPNPISVFANTKVGFQVARTCQSSKRPLCGQNADSQNASQIGPGTIYSIYLSKYSM
jgi:hypothetical protein